MSRVKKTIKNAKVGIFFYTASMLVQFFTRKTFLDYLGDEFMGLTGTLYSILSFLNLAELGIGTAIGFTLYKPIFNNDQNEINSIFQLFGYLYKKIGLIIIVVGLLVSAFFPLIFDSVSFNLSLVYFVFYSFIISSLLGYFFNYHLFLLQADQKTYIVSYYFQTFTLLKSILQAILAIYFESYILWVVLELIAAISQSYALRKRIKKEYPWLIIKNKADKLILKKYPEIIIKIKQVFVHKLSGVILNSTDQLLIFAFVNIQSVAFFGNYQLVITKIIGLVNNFFAGTGASIGNLVAEKNEQNIKKVFWEMMALRYFIAGIISITLFYLVEPFIVLWVGEKYLLDKSILLLMLMNLFIMQIRVPVDNFKQAYGLFADTWAPVAEVILNLGVSIVFGKLWGIAGIMLGTFVSLTLVVLIWKPFYLYKKGFKKSVLSYWLKGGTLLLNFTLASYLINLVIENFVNTQITNYLDWLFLALKIISISTTLYGITLFIISKGFRDFIVRIKSLIMEKL